MFLEKKKLSVSHCEDLCNYLFGVHGQVYSCMYGMPYREKHRRIDIHIAHNRCGALINVITPVYKSNCPPCRGSVDELLQMSLINKGTPVSKTNY